ncbi:MAG: helix-turn-helix domain-containing protein [Phycisphaerae bacterium]|nr:helix-turn-helix domain-containing protein [Phycisphaerae bacterium]
MPNIATVFKEEILRLARKEVRRQTQPFKRASAQYRRDIADMKRQVSDLRRKVALLEKQALKGVSSQTPTADTKRVRFNARGLRSQRSRLGLSAADYGRLIGVTGQTIYSWEGENSRPRKGQLAQIASLRGLGKKEVRTRLEQLAGRQRKGRK